MSGPHDAVARRGLAIVFAAWALVAPDICAVVCGSSHCEGEAGLVGSLARSHEQTLQTHPRSEGAQPHSAQRTMDCAAAPAEFEPEATICRCARVDSLLPAAVDGGPTVARNVMVEALPASPPPAVEVSRELFDVPLHRFPTTNPPLLI